MVLGQKKPPNPFHWCCWSTEFSDLNKPHFLRLCNISKAGFKGVKKFLKFSKIQISKGLCFWLCWQLDQLIPKFLGRIGFGKGNFPGLLAEDGISTSKGSNDGMGQDLEFLKTLSASRTDFLKPQFQREIFPCLLQSLG